MFVKWYEEKMLLKNYQLVGSYDIIKFVIANQQDFKDAVNLIDRGASIDLTYAFSPIFENGNPTVDINELLKWIEEEESLENLNIIINVQIHKFLNVA